MHSSCTRAYLGAATNVCSSVGTEYNIFPMLNSESPARKTICVLFLRFSSVFISHKVINSVLSHPLILFRRNGTYHSSETSFGISDQKNVFPVVFTFLQGFAEEKEGFFYLVQVIYPLFYIINFEPNLRKSYPKPKFETSCVFLYDLRLSPYQISLLSKTGISSLYFERLRPTVKGQGSAL